MANTNRVTVKAVSGSDAFDEGMLRLQFAEDLATYLAVNEGDDEPVAAQRLIAGAAGAIQTLISDATELLAQAHQQAKRSR